jgi:transposase
MKTEKKARRTLTGQQRLELVLEGLKGETAISELCRREGISATIWYRWRDRLFANVDRVFVKEDPGVADAQAAHEAEATRLRAVIAEITEENLALKKTLMPSKRPGGSPRSSGR